MNRSEQSQFIDREVKGLWPQWTPADAEVRAWLERLLFEEVVPVLEGRTDDPAGFARQTLERFANPFLEHRLSDIAMHHAVKLQTRLVPTLGDFQRQFGRSPELLTRLLESELT